MPTPFALLLLALLNATPGLAAEQSQSGELNPRDAFMVMVGVGSGYMSSLCNLEEDKDLCPSQVLPPRRQ